MYLSRDQIAQIVAKVGQPTASVLLNGFFQSYRSELDSADVADLYDEQYWGRLAAHEIYEMVGGRYEVNVYNRFSYQYLLERALPGQRLLDYGCGDGAFAMAAEVGLGLVVRGLDFDASVVAQANARARRDKLDCTFERAGGDVLAGMGSVSYVTLNDVVEHLSDRELVPLLRKVWELLSDEGEVIIHTPNGLALCNDTASDSLQRLYKTYLRLFRGWKGFERTVDQLYYDQVHINIKSYKEIARLLHYCGFSSQVIYDEPRSPRILSFLSPNMLVVARKGTAR